MTPTSETELPTKEKTAPVLVARDLHKTFTSGDRRLAVLRGASLSVSAGESISIRGESGAGKSTLLNLLAGLDTPDSGEVLWRSQSGSFGESLVGGPSRSLKTRELGKLRGIIFQSFYLVPEIDALANVRLAGAICGLARGEAKARAHELLAQVGLSERTHHLPAQLSGGERQRVAIARALIAAPPLVLADEPTGNLDERTGDTIIDLLLGLCRERQTALLLVTHNPAHAAKCTRRLALHNGLFA